jgi:DNA-binding YbaB/EbfC family protein
MGKRKPPRSVGGVGQSGLLRRLQTLQEEMERAQEEIGAMRVTATAGGGAVTVVVTGERRLASVNIAPDAVDPQDLEMLQDMIVAAVNQGLEQVEQAAAEKMSGLTGGLSMPGLI